MEYEGKLYGKVGNGYFPLQETTMYVKQLENTVEFYRKECQNLRDYLTENKIGNPNQGLFDAILEHVKENTIMDEQCKCGHKHSEHHPVSSANYSSGHCTVGECRCPSFAPTQVRVDSHLEIIKCTECGFIQAAKVEHTVPFGTYIHECENCKYTIMESEWLKYNPNTIAEEKVSEGEAVITAEVEDVIAKFVKVARHARNFPHPNIPLGLLKTEAVEAERIAEKVLGFEAYDRINDIAFNQ